MVDVSCIVRRGERFLGGRSSEVKLIRAFSSIHVLFEILINTSIRFRFTNYDEGSEGVLLRMIYL
jgi:hypothetical protein